MLTTNCKNEEPIDIHQYFYENPARLLDLQKGYIPPEILVHIVSKDMGMEAYVRSWEQYLANIAMKPQWRLAGSVEVVDFVQAMLAGYIPSKDAVQSQGGIWNAMNTYDPSRNGQRPTVCPSCGSSFWSQTHGNSWKAFADLGLPEYRTNLNDCRPPVRIKTEGRDKKVCSHIVSGPYESEQAAEIACAGNNAVAQIESQWYVICGHHVNLMSLYNYIHSYIMKPLRAEHKRYLTAKTKGRINVTEAFNCPACGQMNEAHLEDNNDSNDDAAGYYECRHCYARHGADDLTFFTMERGNVSLDMPLGDDGKATIGDMLPSPAFVHEELAQNQAEIQATLGAFTAILQKIVDRHVLDAERRYKDRTLSKIPQLERSLKRANAKNDKAKVEKTQKKLDNERDNLLKDQNKIDYSRNLVEMFKLHYIGDENGDPVDLRTLTERFMFKSLPYTICYDCGNRDYEQNETGKLENQQLAARDALKARAEQEDLPGYDRQEILETPSVSLMRHLGSFFYCSKCQSTHIRYFGPRQKNPDEPRIEITPHIFQPAQREIRDLENEIFAYQLICSNCGQGNLVRPDRMTGQLLDHKISKRVVDDGSGRKAIRERKEHRCQKCNEELTLQDVVTSSKAKDAYSLLLKLQKLVGERENLRRAARLDSGGDDTWSVQSS